MLPGAESVLVRYGEIGTKSYRVRGKMEGRLAENLSALLADRGVDGDVERRGPRLFVETDDVEAATAVATDCFGVVSASPVRRVTPEMDAICETLAEIAPTCYAEGAFAVQARRAGDHDFDSEDVGRLGGRAIWEAVEGDFDPEVDLDDPDTTFYVEVRQDVAYVFTEKRPGPAGMPLGTQDPVVALLSGGIDSPVAAYEVMRRGCPVVLVYLDLGAYGGVDHRARVESVASRLAEFAPNFDMRLRRVPVGDDVEHLVETMERGRMLSFRRFMYRVAEAVANREAARGIVTGEAIGQKSSQTIQNFTVTERATTMPIHRPLLTMDKTDITDRARELGTFDTSTIPAGCNRIAPEHPETNASHRKLREVEPDDLFERAEAAAERVEVLDVAGGDSLPRPE